ncbi:MAG: hypothetical protein Q8876_06640 [Bacillota bacterium]|nr:hypothetical protein [Bacillota bacterium]
MKTNYPNIEISKKQAQNIASAIFIDIVQYIKSHTVEYDEFLRDEEYLGQAGGEKYEL